MEILGIDPGSEESALVEFNTSTWLAGSALKIKNEDAIPLVQKTRGRTLVVEMIKSYGNAMGDTTINTCVWIGRFIEAYTEANPDGRIVLIPRKTIVTAICNSPKANDSNVRQALIDLFAARTSPDALGGGKVPVIGNKARPGPLYSFAGDTWSALAVCVAFTEIEKRNLEILERLAE